MKTIKYIFAIFILSVAFTSCTDENDDESFIPNPVEGLTKIYEVSEADHSIILYSEKQPLEVGYNEIAIRIKDKASDSYINNAEMSWMPMMHMEGMAHSAPHSMLNNALESSVYNGHIVFQMASNDSDYWELKLNYNFNGQPMEKTLRIYVAQPADGLVKTQVFMGSDNIKYVLALVNPKNPQVAGNDMQALLYKMENMMDFPIVEDYKIKVDPRMPGMGNHSSPNNQDLRYNTSTKIYEGRISLTMTGYWKINMQLINKDGEVIKGEEVTDENAASSLYFDLEF